jgi:hypothetical protein
MYMLTALSPRGKLYTCSFPLLRPTLELAQGFNSVYAEVVEDAVIK